MIPYSSALPMKSCYLELMSYYQDWRWLLSPASVASVTKSNRHLLNMGYAIDNGAYAYWSKGVAFNEKAFLRLLDKYAENADWIVIPDSIGNWEETVKMFMLWTARIWQYNRPLMLVAQDGAERDNYAEIRAVTRRNFGLPIGIFVGGSTDWKLTHAPILAQICIENNALCHIGRVNSAKRTRLCSEWGATSFDGSGMSRYSATARRVSREMQLLTLTDEEKEKLS